jgi:hypothetical protein
MASAAKRKPRIQAGRTRRILHGGREKSLVLLSKRRPDMEGSRGAAMSILKPPHKLRQFGDVGCEAQLSAWPLWSRTMKHARLSSMSHGGGNRRGWCARIWWRRAQPQGTKGREVGAPALGFPPHKRQKNVVDRHFIALNGRLNLSRSYDTYV